MPHSTVLFVHLQYDAPDSPQSRALRALAATIARTAAPPLYLVGGYAHDDFDTDSLPLAVAQAVRVAHQDRTDTAMAGHLRDHVAALAAAQVAVTPLLRAGAPQTVLAQVAGEVDAALVLIGIRKARQDFVSALGGSYAALQAALPCPVYRVMPSAAGDPRGWALVTGGVGDRETAKQRPAPVYTAQRSACADTDSTPDRYLTDAIAPGERDHHGHRELRAGPAHGLGARLPPCPHPSPGYQ